MYRPAKALPHNDPFDRVMLAKKLLLKYWRFCRFFDDSCGNRGSCGANEGGASRRKSLVCQKVCEVNAAQMNLFICMAEPMLRTL